MLNRVAVSLKFNIDGWTTSPFFRIKFLDWLGRLFLRFYWGGISEIWYPKSAYNNKNNNKCPLGYPIPIFWKKYDNVIHSSATVKDFFKGSKK